MNRHDMPDEGEVARARWTAYALGQLEGDELTAVEREVADDADAARFVEEIRALAGHVRAARREEPLPAASIGLQQRIVEALGDKEVGMGLPNRVQPSCLADRRHRRRSLWGTAAASFVAGGIVVGLILPAFLRPHSGVPAGATARLPGSAEARAGKPPMAPSIGPEENAEARLGEDDAKPDKPVAVGTVQAQYDATGSPASETPFKVSSGVYPRMVPPLTGGGTGMGPYPPDAAAYSNAYSGTVPPPTVPGHMTFSLGGVNSDAGLMGSIVVDEQDYDWRHSSARWDDVRAGKAWRGDGQRFRIEPGGGHDAYAGYGATIGHYYPQPPQTASPQFADYYSGGHGTVRGFDFRGAAEKSSAAVDDNEPICYPPSDLWARLAGVRSQSSVVETSSANVVEKSGAAVNDNGPMCYPSSDAATKTALFGYSQLGVSTIRGEQLPGVRQYHFSDSATAGTVIRDNNGLTASSQSPGGRWVDSGLIAGKPIYEWRSDAANADGKGKWSMGAEVSMPLAYRGMPVHVYNPRFVGGGEQLNRIDQPSRVGMGRETQSLMMTVNPRVLIQEEEEERIDAGLTPSYGHLSEASRPHPSPHTEQYAPIIENRFLAPFAAPLSTFSIDVDTASYANVRRFLDGGQLPPPDAVRVEEMVNYFSYDYAKPEGDEPFSVGFELADCPWKAGHQLLRIGLKGREVKRTRRGASNLVFLLDVSGSMGEENKLSLVKQAMRLLVDELGEGDRVAIVTYATEPAVRLESTNGENKKKILKAIDSLVAEGWTNGSGGIELAYDEAAKHFQKEGDNRIILATDGDLNVGVTKDEELVRLIKKKAKSGVFLTVLGFGQGNLKDSKLEKLADCGNGAYAYVDSLREARKVLVEQLTGSLYTIAKDVKIQIEFNPGRVAAYRLIGYENRRLAARDFNNDKKDAGEIGAGHTVTALYELVPAKADDEEDAAATGPALKYQKIVRPASTLTDAADRDELATVRLRYKEPDGKKSRLIERVVGSRGTSFAAASGDFQFAAAVAAFGMVLRGSQYAGDATLAAVEEYATPGLSNDAKGHRAGFIDLVRKARKLKSDVATATKRSWGPEQATGAPDTHRAGDSPTAWASLGADGGIEWLQVEFDRAVAVAEVRIRENDNPGAVSRVVAVVDGWQKRPTPDGRHVKVKSYQEHELWVGQDPTNTAPTDFVVRAEGDVTSRTIRIYLDTTRKPGWNEIDAVELVGKDGSRQWASRATASSSYADR